MICTPMLWLNKGFSTLHSIFAGVPVTLNLRAVLVLGMSVCVSQHAQSVASTDASAGCAVSASRTDECDPGAIEIQADLVSSIKRRSLGEQYNFHSTDRSNIEVVVDRCEEHHAVLEVHFPALSDGTPAEVSSFLLSVPSVFLPDRCLEGERLVLSLTMVEREETPMSGAFQNDPERSPPALGMRMFGPAGAVPDYLDLAVQLE